MKKSLNAYVGLIVAASSLVLFFGCKKQVSTLTEPSDAIDTTAKVIAEVAPIDTSDEVSFKEIDLDEKMANLVKENMKVILFDYNSYSIGDFERDQLAVASKFLKEYPDLRVLAEGHCDERGSSEYNMGLGENRARAVKNYLVNLGIEGGRLEITSWGKEQPAQYGCTNDECHRENRRVTFKVISRN